MKRPITLLALMFVAPLTAFSHPGSGIAVDDQGNVFFMDTGAGVWQLLSSGELNKLPGRAYHWLALDPTGQLAKTPLPTFPEGGIERSSHNVLIASDFPLTVDAQGRLYVPSKQGGRVRVFRVEPSGSVATLATIAERADGSVPGWISGSAVGPDGSFYYTEDRGVWKIAPSKAPVALPISVKSENCRPFPGMSIEDTMMYRGIAVDASGNIFVAVAGCQAVMKIAPDHRVSTVVQTTGAWSPTGVATLRNDVYVLEYLHTEGHNRREWIPRIRKVKADGTSSIIATVERQ